MSTLSLGSVHDKDGFGMGHFPITKRAFAAWKPVVMGYEEVRQEELVVMKFGKIQEEDTLEKNSTKISSAPSCAARLIARAEPRLPVNDNNVKISLVSVVEIIKELPKLTAEERADVRRRLRELEERDGSLFLHESADALFQDMDKQEAKNARRKAR